MIKVDMVKFCESLEWYKTNYRDQYDGLPFLMGEVEPEDQEKYDELCDMIKALRTQYHDYNRQEKTEAKNKRILDKQMEAIEKGKDYVWVMKELNLSKSSYKYSVMHDEMIASYHRQLLKVHNSKSVTVKDVKTGRMTKHNSMRNAEMLYGWSKSTVSEFLRRADHNPKLLYRGRYKIERC